MRGLTLQSIHPAAERCQEGPDCVEGISVNEVHPRVWVLMIDVTQSPEALALVGKLLLPDGEKVRTVALPRIHVQQGDASEARD